MGVTLKEIKLIQLGLRLNLSYLSIIHTLMTNELSLISI